MSEPNVTVLGAGSWGTALATVARRAVKGVAALLPGEHDFTALSMQHSPLTADSVAEATLRAVARRRFFLAVTSWKVPLCGHGLTTRPEKVLCLKSTNTVRSCRPTCLTT